jgi:nitroreductase
MTAKNPHLLQALHTRRSVPVSLLGGPGPDEADVQALLHVALRVPDHGRLEPWRIILMRGDARIEAGKRIAELAEKLNGPLTTDMHAKELQRFSRAPLVIIVVSAPVEHPRIPHWEQFLSAGAVGMNLLYGAMALGYGASWVTGWYSDDAEGRRILGLQPQERVAAIVHVGNYEGDVPERPRPDVSKKISEYNLPPGDA